VREAIREDEKRAAQEKLEALLLEVLKSEHAVSRFGRARILGCL
jgi:hypothetical protein